MIVPFVLDPDALKVPGQPSPETRGIHDRFLELWNLHGLLVHDGPNLEHSSIRDAVERLPVGLRKRWKQAMIRNQNRIRPAPRGWAGLDGATSSSCFDVVDTLAETACVSENLGQQLGIVEGHDFVEIEGRKMDAVLFPCAPNAPAFRKMRDTSSRLILKGTSGNELWDERFMWLARSARSVVIVDRFAVDSAVRFGETSSGLRGFLERLSQAAQTVSVTLYSSRNPPKTRNEETRRPKEISDSISRLLDGILGKGLSYFSLYLVPDRTFESHAHGRYIRFDHGVCEIDVGVEIFQGAIVRRNSTFSYFDLGQDRLEIENKLHRECTFSINREAQK